MDDIYIFSKDVYEHIDHVDEIIDTLRDAEVTLHLKTVAYLSLSSITLFILSSPEESTNHTQKA